MARLDVSWSNVNIWESDDLAWTEFDGRRTSRFSMISSIFDQTTYPLSLPRKAFMTSCLSS